MATSQRELRRMNRKHVLDALKGETKNSGGDVAAARVDAYCADPLAANTTEFGHVGGLTLRRFYIAPDMPSQNQRRSLWANLRQRLALPQQPVPQGWDGNTDVMTLQMLAEETP